MFLTASNASGRDPPQLASGQEERDQNAILVARWSLARVARVCHHSNTPFIPAVKWPRAPHLSDSPFKLLHKGLSLLAICVLDSDTQRRTACAIVPIFLWIIVHLVSSTMIHPARSWSSELRNLGEKVWTDRTVGIHTVRSRAVLRVRTGTVAK
jgi:hypothetical protein